MELFIILVLTITVFLISVMNLIKDEKFVINFILFLCSYFTLSYFTLLSLISYTNKPKAIDVYKGKTTLEITYKDKVPIDSTVVWKDNK